MNTIDFKTASWKEISSFIEQNKAFRPNPDWTSILSETKAYQTLGDSLMEKAPTVLSGTEKQVEWAKKLRYQLIDHFSMIYLMEQVRILKGERLALTKEEAQMLWNCICAFIKRGDSAFFINNRNKTWTSREILAAFKK